MAFWKHKKRGHVYEVLSDWVRPTPEFLDGRFEEVPFEGGSDDQ